MKHLAMIVFAATGLFAAADEQAISTDRPDYTEATDTVPRGWLQLETGFMVSSHTLRAGPSNYFGGPFPLIRVGLSRNLELRWGSDGFASESEFGTDRREHHTGLSDFETGVKYRFAEERKYTPALAVIAGFSIPAGATYFTSGHVDPLVDLCWSKSLPHEFDLAGNVNFKRLVASSITEKAFSVTSGKKLGRGFGAFVEVYRIAPIEGDEARHWIADAGFTKLLGSNIQFDTFLGHTIGARTPCWFVGAGFAVRMPGPTISRLITRR
jgi:hypothetical protein